MIAEVFETFDRAALAALQARDIARVRAADYFSKKDDSDVEAEAELARWDEYLSGFAKLEGGKCLCCGDRLGGSILERAMGYAGGRRVGARVR